MTKMIGLNLQRAFSRARVVLSHAEAFMLMRYENRSTGHSEWLWNTGDGVTPFGLTDPTVPQEQVDAWKRQWDAQESVPAGGRTRWLHANPDPRTLHHSEWAEDAFAPNFVPPVGMRVFYRWGDAILPEHVRAEAREAWAKKLAEFPQEVRDVHSQGEPFQYTADSPLVATVTEDMRAEFARLAVQDPWKPVLPGIAKPTHTDKRRFA